MTKLLIIGHGRHGKDTVAEILSRLTGLSFASSSWVLAEEVVMPHLAEHGLTYDSVSQCYKDRDNHRQVWKDCVTAYCDPADRLAKRILRDNDMYVGIRTRREFEASRVLFDHVIWVDRSAHLPPEPTCELTADDADIHIDNNGRVEDLIHTVAVCVHKELSL